MHPNGFAKTSRFIPLLLLLLGSAVPATAQWEMGPYSTLNRPAGPPLRKSGNVRSYAFVSQVGGVAFAAVAEPGPGLAGKPLTLRYDPTREDGSRLSLRVGEAAVTVHLPDWQLIPIARYAETPYNACVSLFGDETSETRFQVLYHPAFENELLGVRLFQADILLMDLDESWRLPSYRGQVLLGTGEAPPASPDLQTQLHIHQALADAQFRSWVLSDEGERLRADVVDGRLRLTGEPYYYFWDADLAPRDALVKEVEALQAKIDRHNSLVNRHNALMARGEVSELPALAEAINRLAHETRGYPDLVARIDGFDPAIQESPATGRLKARRSSLRSFNPAVFDAATRTAQFAAFFRWVKREHPQAWSSFMSQITDLRTTPRLETPTNWPSVGSARAR